MTLRAANGTSSGMLTQRRRGYTLLEIVIALFLFTVGGLALVAISAVIGRELDANAVRERAGRIAASRLEVLGANCRGASGGREIIGRIESEWSVSFPDSSHLSVLESIKYPTRRGGRTDLYRATLACPP
jgi:Tfp pilus assembly protein FimT